MLKPADNTRPDSLATRLRRRRFALFLELADRLPAPLRILDVGGTEDFWRMMRVPWHAGWHVTLLNLERRATTLPGFDAVHGDARSMRGFADSSFDAVFSNSVIEHFATFAEQRRVAEEIARVGKRYFVQTPNRRFPMEPHFLFPFFQYLPLFARARLLRRFRLGWHKRQPDLAAASLAVRGIRLLDLREMKLLFPGASFYRERLLGMTKSFVAYRGWPPDPCRRSRRRGLGEE